MGLRASAVFQILIGTAGRTECWFVHGHRVRDSHAARSKCRFTFCGLRGCWAESKPRDLRMECQVALHNPAALTAYNCEALGRLRRAKPHKKKCLDWGSAVDTFIDL